MSFKMTWNITEIKNWVENQPKRDMAKRQALTVMKDELVKEVRGEMQDHNSSGNLLGHTDGYATDRKITIQSPFYGDIVLEYGRRPGKMPPIGNLERWATLHGMPGAGFAIARKIARQGTKKYRQGGPKQLTSLEKKFKNEILVKRIPELLNKYTQ